MTPEDVTAALNTRKATIAAQRADMAQAQRPHTTQTSDLHLPFAIGARVFDTVSGLYGLVVGGTPASAKAGETAVIQLTTGATVTRNPAYVVARPTPPPAK